VGRLAPRLFLLVLWSATGAGSFWPVWVCLPTGLADGSALVMANATSAFAQHLGLSTLTGLFLIGAWAASGLGTRPRFTGFGSFATHPNSRPPGKRRATSCANNPNHPSATAPPRSFYLEARAPGGSTGDQL
jgi:hypothetical protein